MNSFVPYSVPPSDPATPGDDILIQQDPLQSIADNVPVLIARVDCELRYLFANRAYQDLLGFPPEQVVGRTMPEVLGPAAYAAVRGYVDRVLAGESVTFEAQLDYVTVGQRWIHGSYVPERDPSSGEVSGFLLSAMDVTAGRAVEEANRQFALILEHSYEAILSTDLDGFVRSWNAGAERIFGYTAVEAIGRYVAFLYRPEDRPQLPERRAAFGEGVLPREYEGVRRRKDGTECTVLYTLWPMQAASGARIGFASIVRDVTAQKEAEAETKRLALLVESSHEAILSTGLDGTILSWNKGAEQLYGYTAEEAVGRSIGLVYPPEEAGEIPKRLGVLKQGGDALSYEAFRVRKDGARRLVAVTISPIGDGSEEVAGHVSVARDITDQKQAEEAAQLLSQIVEHSQDAIVGTGLDGTILSWNKGAERLLGYTAAEAVGKSVGFLQPPADQVHLRERLQSLERGEEVPEFEAVRIGKDGQARQFAITISPVRDSRGLVTSHAAIMRDITVQKEAQEATLRLALLVESSHDAIISTNLDGTIMTWNRGAERLFGYPAAEAIGNPMGFLRPPEAPALLEARMELLRRGETVPEYSAVRIGKDGAPRNVSVTLSPIRDSRGVVTSFAAIMRDITAQKAAEEVNKRLARIVEYSHDAIVGSALDGTILSWNKGAERLFGHTAAEAVGRPVALIHPPGESESHAGRLAKIGRGETVPEYETVRIGKDGAARTVAVTLSLVRDQDGGVLSHAAIMRDITAQKAAEREQKEADREQKEADRERRRLADSLRLLLDSSGEGIFGLDRAGNFTFLNPAAAHMLGAEPAPLLGKHAHTAICHTYPDGRSYPFEECPLFQAISAGRECRVDEEVFWRLDGSSFPVHYCATPIFEDGQVSGCVVTFADSSERKAWEAERERRLAEATERADRDPLTGLLNHRAFHKRLEEETERCRRDGSFLAVAMMDLSHFKFFNDAYGHLVGDDALRRVAEALRQSCRTYDVIVRFGGDEFAVLMPGAGRAEATAAADRLAERLQGLSLRPLGSLVEVPLELTMGVAVFPEEFAENGGTSLDVVALADTRLYAAKSGANVPRGEESFREQLVRTVEGFAMLDALVTAVDSKDRYTRRHADDVLQTALSLAEALGLDDAARHTVSLAALLQEVGRIGVPDRILRKPGPLTDAEWEAVKQHPALGALLIGAVPSLSEIVEAVRHHHERWDGGGYPGGLAGDAIPFLARLLAVADAYAAMTADRPYRRRLTDSQARTILADGAGLHWDPACVAAFLGG
jgi:diguanylate cyclase (GGDEF)-like protein/PAS domain S-box-containing protein